MVDYYAVLGVNPSAEDVVIRAAYKALAQRYHPDRFAGSKEVAHRRMSELTQAYEVLADPVRRPKYDRRRTFYTRAVASRFNRARRFASAALDPRAYRSVRQIHLRYRVALAALLSAVVVLSAFNLYNHSGRIRGWLGLDPAGSSGLSASQREAYALYAAIQMGPPLPPASQIASPARPPGKDKKRTKGGQPRVPRS